jgi:hypothetical protein
MPAATDHQFDRIYVTKRNEMLQIAGTPFTHYKMSLNIQSLQHFQEEYTQNALDEAIGRNRRK